MDESIGVLCKTLASFCNHLQSSCDALKQSIERRPIPLDSASSTFVQCLNRRVCSTSSDLNLLENMSLGTVSFEELLGYCNEVYKKNQSDLSELEDHLRAFGYTPELEMDEEDETSDDSCASPGLGLKTIDVDPLYPFLDLMSSTAHAPVDWELRVLPKLFRLEDSLSLQDLGLSAVCLATIASQGEVGDDLELVGVHQSVIKISKDDYESLPSYMKVLASWEDLLAAVEKMNSSLGQKQITEGRNFIHQDELASLDLGLYLKFLALLSSGNQPKSSPNLKSNKSIRTDTGVTLRRNN
ncbi:hypothetical protein Vadar_024136 [Vaccinium darrowii]|uniref:Uncharacterized protein n=1 Tax=Vaccinium darrowii TaxID=229202 RepID=A0ACB7YQA0_9ERIC|nr:hypothetical protein Vadar_024136 [Vaccinium darrowii]